MNNDTDDEGNGGQRLTRGQVMTLCDAIDQWKHSGDKWKDSNNSYEAVHWQICGKQVEVGPMV